MSGQINFISTAHTALIRRHYDKYKTTASTAEIKISKPEGAAMSDTIKNREKLAASCLDMVKKMANDARMKFVSNYTEDEYIGYALLGMAEAIEAWFSKDVAYREKMAFSTFCYSYIFKHLTQGVNRDEAVVSGMPLADRYIESKRVTVWADSPMDDEGGDSLFDNKIGSCDKEKISDTQAIRFKKVWDSILSPRERSAIQYTFGIMLPREYSIMLTRENVTPRLEYMAKCTYTDKNVVSEWLNRNAKIVNDIISTFTRRAMSKIKDNFSSEELQDLYIFFSDRKDQHWYELNNTKK